MTDNYIKETEHYAMYVMEATNKVPSHYAIFNKRYGVVEWEGNIFFMGLATIGELEQKLIEIVGEPKQTTLLSPIEGEVNYNH